MKPGYQLSKVSKWRFPLSLLPTAQCIGGEKTSTLPLPPTTSFRPKTVENAGIHESTDPSALTADCGRKAAKGRRQRQPAPLRCLARLVHSCSARLARASRPCSLDASV